MTIEFTQIPGEQIHPVDRFGFDPIPGNNGHYYWVAEQGWVPGPDPDWREKARQAIIAANRRHYRQEITA